MSSKQEIGATLRQARIKSNKSVQEASAKLIDNGIKASVKTIYSWENGNSQPSPDALLLLCDLYEVKDILLEFGYKAPRENKNLDNKPFSKHEEEIIYAYRKADADSKSIVDTALRKYMHPSATGSSSPKSEASGQ